VEVETSKSKLSATLKDEISTLEPNNSFQRNLEIMQQHQQQQ
jgi:hypothetical protein